MFIPGASAPGIFLFIVYKQEQEFCAHVTRLIQRDYFLQKTLDFISQMDYNIITERKTG